MTDDEYCELIQSRLRECECPPAYERLLALVSQALCEYPSSSRLHVIKGDVLFASRIDERKGDLDRLATDDAEGELVEALICYRWAVELDPDSEEGRASVGHFLDSASGDLPGAEAAFRRALDLGSSADSYAGLARVLAEQGREQEALSLLMPPAFPFFDDERLETIKAKIQAGDWGPPA